MLIFFAAKWDISSNYVEKVTFENIRVKSSLKRHGATALYADFTSRNPEGLVAMKRLNRSSTPLVPIYHPGARDSPTIFAGLPSIEDLVTALNSDCLTNGAHRRE